MTTRSKLLSATLVALMGTTAVGAFAATDTGTAAARATQQQTQPAAKPDYKTQTEMLKTADEAMTTLNEVRAARLALINNDIETARAKLEKATKAFDDSAQQWKALTLKDVTTPGNASDYVPFDVSMALGESFTATPASQKAVTEANQHIQTGDQNKALDVLRVNDVDVTLSAALLPVTETHDHLQYAMQALDKGNYFDANLALKAIDDGILIQSFGIDAIPQQGNAG